MILKLSGSQEALTANPPIIQGGVISRGWGEALDLT